MINQVVIIYQTTLIILGNQSVNNKLQIVLFAVKIWIKYAKFANIIWNLISKAILVPVYK